MSIFWFVGSFLRARKALQWWSQRQAQHLSVEAEKIRDGLLQENFSIRRNLEMAILDNAALSSESSEDYLQTMEQLYYSLKELSDRLSPEYIYDSLPLAIQGVLEPWLKRYPQLNLKIDTPINWRHESPDRSILIVRTLEELLKIILPDVLTNISIYFTLKLEGDMAELMVKVTYPDISTRISCSSSQDLEYLRETFQFLTPGKCCYIKQDLSLGCYFRW
ncbi:MAG: hypothetical protein VKL59_05380 [Nostocaceae cyanobacterium]|nr:hypothetical protein [Nostocaceae cyanobacterium]